MPKNITAIPYLSIIWKAFSLTWKNRYLWWFGFFAMLSNLGGLNYLSGESEKSHPQKQVFFENISHHPHWIAIGMLVLAIIIIAFAILSVISRGALISSINKLHRHNNTDFKTGFQAGKKYFGKIFSIALFSGFFTLAALLILAPPVVFLFLNHNYFLGFIMVVLAFSIFVPLIILISFLRIFGYLYTIIGNLNPWAAIENAYVLFRKNIAASLVMAILFIPINLFFFLLVIFALIPITLVILPLGILLFLFAGTLGAMIAVIFGLAILAVFVVFLRSTLEVFTQAIWIFFFYELAAPPEKEIAAESAAEIKPLPEAGLSTIS
ncbi:MAG: hypothetical protein WC022_01780 [Parcubacteria group bacterium]